MQRVRRRVPSLCGVRSGRELRDVHPLFRGTTALVRRVYTAPRSRGFGLTMAATRPVPLLLPCP